MRIFALLVLLITNIFCFEIVSAQNIPPDLTITTIPSDPQPLDVVIITAKSLTLDLDRANMEWKYNGKTIAEGTGKKSVKITAPESGGTAIITAKVSATGLREATQSIVIRPGGVDMLWEAVDAYTPPFYKGKAILPYGGVLRVTAVPGTASPKTVTFNWKRNGIPMQNSSGFGRSSLLFKEKDLDTNENIEVETNNGTFSTSGSVDVIPQQPYVVAYENKEGFIDYAKGSLESIAINGTGAILRFEPYFFSSPISIKNDLDMSIFVDNEKVGVNKPNELSVTADQGNSGEIGLEVFTKEYSLQNAKTIFNVIFN